MNRTQPTLTQIIWRVMIVVSLVAPALLIIDQHPARAGGGLPPFFGLIPAHMRRNRVYRTAEAYIDDRNAYYDALRETAAQQLLDRELHTGLRDSQVAGYIKVINLIEQERQAALGFAEGEKKQARDQFIATAGDELKGLILSTTPVTRVLGAFSDGINSSQGFIQGAITKLTGGAGGILEDVAKVRRIAERMGIAGQLIGGKLGEALRKGSAKIADLTKPVDLIEADLTKVLEELGALGGHIADLQEQGYTPVASQTAREVAVTLVTGEGDPAIELIADLLVAKHGGGGGFHDRAKDVMLGTGAARCRAKADQMRQVYFKMQIDPEGEEENEEQIFPSCSTAEVPSLVDQVADADFPEAEESDETVEAEESDPQDTADGSSGDTETAADPADGEMPPSTTEYIWVLAETVVNPANAQTSFQGGIPGNNWFDEARFEGKSVDFTCTATSFGISEVNMDHGYEYFNVTLGVNFDAPPAQLDSGQEYTLSASASSGGSVNEGNPGLAFQYHLNDVGQQPIFGYSPWNPEFDGTSSMDWTFTAPITSTEGSEYTVTAGLWNVAPCHVVWIYSSQFNQNRAEAPPEEESNLPPAQTEADPACQAQRQEVADKVSIARGADTADLALGIVGYLRVSKGDVQIDYCEGGSANAEKGIPIRIGDCIRTTGNGRAQAELNDRDTKYNADPTIINISRNSEMCFDGFTVHRDDGKPGWIDLLHGAARIITHGWQPNSGLGVNVGIRAAVTVASDVVLDYNPTLDMLHTYVNEGNVGVTNLGTGESQQLKDNQKLTTYADYDNTVERMSNRDWKDILADHELDLEESFPTEESTDRAAIPLILIGVALCGGGALVLAGGGFFLYRRRKKKAGENGADPSTENTE